MNLNKELSVEFYKKMFQIRTFEERANELYLSGKMPGLTHMYAGQEGVAVGVCSALNQHDYITSTHRGHGHCLAKGAVLKLMFCELLGKEEGYCKGKGGSMHIADQKNGNLGANAIVGGSTGIATGAAFSSKRKGTGQVVVCFFGDGALGQGILYEVMNMASLWNLPIIYVCENNLYGEYTHYSEITSGDIKKRAEAFNIEAFEEDGQNVVSVYNLILKLKERLQKGEGPFFVNFNTYRYYGHHVGDINREYYRSKEEEEYWKNEKDPLKIFSKKLIKENILSKSEFNEIEQNVLKEAKVAVEYALNAPYPNLSSVYNDVYVN